MRATGDMGGMAKLAARIVRRLAVCTLMLAPLAAHAGPAPGTLIANQASASGQQGVTPLAATSNTVSLAVGSAGVGSFAAALAASTQVDSTAGATVYIAHTLTNTGSAADTYVLTAADAGTGYVFTSVTLFADANGDGQPDSAVALANPIALGAGQVLRFVVRLVVPAGAQAPGQAKANIAATSAGGATIASIGDIVVLPPAVVRDCAAVTKFLSRDHGPSPASPITVTLTYSSCDRPRSRVLITDLLPAGMRYIPGSGRWSLSGAAPLTDGVVGSDLQGAGPSQIAYDFGVTLPNAVTAAITNIPRQSSGMVQFDVEIAPGIALGTSVPNSARYVFNEANGAYGTEWPTNVATYLVDGRADFELTGQRLPTATPGETVTFTNVLQNRGDVADTFDITLAGSTFPAGTTIALFKSDGVTPLADTDGDGTPDTGVVPGGGSYRIIVRVRIPESAPPAAYKVTKTARSASMASHTSSADDAVETLASKCAITLDPDNAAQVGFGQHVTYTHYLTNHGNCQETVRAVLDYLHDSRPGWTSAAYIDNRVAGAGSLPGALDRTDTPITQGWSATLAPGESLRLLVDVRAPTFEEAKTAAAAAKSVRTKAFADSNLTTLVVTSAGSGALIVRDTTNVDDKDGPAEPSDAIRNFTDASYAAPTLWGVIGGSLYLRADAASCNAVSDVVESRIVTLTGPNGEREEITAVESGPNTGIFVLPPLPVRAPPVIAGDRVVQGGANDTFDIEILGCGKRIATVVTLMAPVSVVFDSRTNDPVAGASVTLVAASGGQCTSTAATFGADAANPAVTGTDGRFSFPPLPAGSYCLAVKPPNGYRFASKVQWTLLPQGRNLNVTGLASGGSYGTAFALAAGGMVVIDLPVDAVAQDGLFIQKDASRATAEIGDFVDYTVRLRNGTGNRLNAADVALTDDLPAGFAFVAGTARREGSAIADPKGGKGPRLALSLGRLDVGEQITVTYRVRIGPGAMQGDGVNRVRASYTANGSTTLSNVATALVRVTGGVFTDKGFILGKVFMDCNANGVQDAGELGVPGVRLLLEDGTFVATDGGGKFSFYGVSNRTHVLKADRTSLPAGARLAVISSRNLGDPASRIVDMKSGELHRGDFAIAGCEPAVVEEVKSRAEALARRADELSLAATQLTTEARAVTDGKALPASGVVGVTTPGVAAATLPGAEAQTAAPGRDSSTVARTKPAANGAAGVKPAEELEALVPGLDNKLGFIGLADGATLAYAQAPIRVKGAAGAPLELVVNGKPVPESRVGKRSVLEERQLQAWEYIGVDLAPGENTLLLVQRDAFGNERGRESIRITAPGKLARIDLEVVSEAPADGRTPVNVVVKLSDERGVPVTVRTPVTLDTTRGAWEAADLDPQESGVQVMVEGGRGTFALMAPLEPGQARLIASSGKVKAEKRLDFMPELRSLIAAGVVEGVINLRRIDTRSLVPARQQDGFEQELQQLSRSSGDGRREAGARAAFFLKGKIRGEYLLTAAYDSDKDTRERLFRDIQPDEFYPIYGDSSVRGYDAQSTSKMYLRVDHRRSYLLFGDFNTAGDVSVRRLSAYSRSLTGAREHYESGGVEANFFASRDSTRQQIDEIRANGTSGPYTLSSSAGLVNSDKVEVLTRDRNRPSLVIASAPQARFYDYEIEPLTGRLLFKAPVPSVDRDLNPITIRITYEVDQGGAQFWVFGGDARVKLGERVEVGASFAEDRNPSDPFKLRGAHAVVRLGERTSVTAEFARTERPETVGQGDAARIHVKHDGENLKAEAFVARTDPTFDNPGAYLDKGRGESGLRAAYKLGEHTTLKAEALRTEDTSTHNVRDGYMAAIEHEFSSHMKAELGLRHAREAGGPAILPSIASAGSVGTTPNEVTSVRARVTSPVPGLKDANVYGEVEVDTQDSTRKVLAVGGDYTLPQRSKIYFRHEFISSLTGPYGLNEQQRQNSTILGVDTEYMKDARLFSEYRIHNAISGGDAEAAIGLRNLWTLAEGLRLGTTFERVQSLSGAGENENTAIALGLEYVASPLWKGSTRIELRKGAANDSALHTIGFASRMSREWTFLGRNTFSIQRNRGGELDGAEHILDRLQAGVAYRDADTDRVNALARVEHREERDDTQPSIALRRSSEIFSLHADYKLSRPFLVTGHYAAKWTREDSNGISSRYRAQLVGGRATWEFAKKWDVGLAASGLFGESAGSRQYGLGIEVGYLLATNLWLSAGYNVFGYHDEDLAAGDYTNKGAYVRLRYKFDESLMGQGEGAR